MIYRSYLDVPSEIWRWNNFSPDEPNIYCPCCGEFFLDFQSMDMLQKARKNLNKALQVNSGHRCLIHNARVGGAPLSQHKKIAFDISLRGHDKGELYDALREAGFSTFGFYVNFIHTDIRPGRVWFSKGGKEIWESVVTFLD